MRVLHPLHPVHPPPRAGRPRDAAPLPRQPLLREDESWEYFISLHSGLLLSYCHSTFRTLPILKKLQIFHIFPSHQQVPLRSLQHTSTSANIWYEICSIKDFRPKPALLLDTEMFGLRAGHSLCPAHLEPNSGTAGSKPGSLRPTPTRDTRNCGDATNN